MINCFLSTFHCCSCSFLTDRAVVESIKLHFQQYRDSLSVNSDGNKQCYDFFCSERYEKMWKRWQQHTDEEQLHLSFTFGTDGIGLTSSKHFWSYVLFINEIHISKRFKDNNGIVLFMSVDSIEPPIKLWNELFSANMELINSSKITNNTLSSMCLS